MTTTLAVPMSAPHDKCGNTISDGFTKQGKKIFHTCNNPAEVWLINQNGEPMIVAGSHCMECADRTVGQWNSKFPDEPWTMTPIREYIHPFTPIPPFKIITISSISEVVAAMHESFGAAADDLLSRSSRSCAWVLEDARGEKGRYSKNEVEEMDKTRLINVLCDAAGEPRKDESMSAMIDRMLSAVTIVKASSVVDYLDRYYKSDRQKSAMVGYDRDVILESYTEELSRLGFVHTSHYDNTTGEHIAWPFYATAWMPTECAEGDTGRTHWRLIRHILNGDGTREFEYASTEEKGVLEFVSYEIAYAVAESWGAPIDHTPAPPQSTYGFGGGRTVAKPKKTKATTATFDLEDI